MASLSLPDLKGLAEAWLTAGLDPSVAAPVTAAIDRSNAIGVERRCVEGDPKEIAERLAEGEIGFSEALLAHVAATAAKEPPPGKTSPRSVVIYRAARSYLELKATNHLRDKGEALLTEHIAPAFVKMATEADKVALRLAGISSPAEAMKQGKTATDWHKLTELDTQRAALHKLARSLRLFGLIGGEADQLHRSFFKLIPQPVRTGGDAA